MDGTILFARYAFMPNMLNYCGGNDNKAIFDYCAANRTDPGLAIILRKFQAAYPYLKLIARANDMEDPFDTRVVEAYWIGNDLLNRVDLAQFHNSLRERFARQLNPATLNYLLGKPSAGARAHHSFHVFDVHSRVGALEHSLDAMENCRIGWGRIKETGITHFTVEHRPLVLEGSRLKLGDFIEKKVLRQINGTGFIADPQIGDLISFHWNWACDILAPVQVKNLERYTSYHLEIANQTL
ncbi:DUF6390 family protein [Chloroflexota bacterium]